MKYTNYLIKKNFVHLEALEVDNRYFKIPMKLLSIPVAVIGISFILSMLPGCIIIDEARGVFYLVIKVRRRFKL